MTAAVFSENPFSVVGDAVFSEKTATPGAPAAVFSENQFPPAVHMKLHSKRDR